VPRRFLFSLLSAKGGALSELRAAGRAALAAARLPSTRDEAFRFTDLSALTQAPLTPTAAGGAASAAAVASLAASLSFDESASARIVLVDGVFAPLLSTPAATLAAALPRGALLAPLSSLSSADAARAAPHVFSAASATTSAGAAAAAVLPALNAACASDALLFLVPSGAVVPFPVHVLHISTGAGGAPGGGATPASAPRLLLALEAGASATLVEEYALLGGASEGVTGGPACVNAVTDVSLAEDATLTHAYIACGGGAAAAAGSAQLATTRVAQAARSGYTLTHVSLTARGLSRHDVSVTQLGPATATTQRAFLLVGADATGDLHTSLALDHPDATADQLHKCIAAAPTARGVFDGAVRVGRAAQRTDAKQLSRNLLLVPRATVHVKPNLQIVADDVKCTHGCTVSDLEEEELFYFRARGIDAAAAREALVYSFGAEVVSCVGAEALAARLRVTVRDALLAAARGA
jgi:Fe-S cluster assembly protein SufD